MKEYKCSTKFVLFNIGRCTENMNLNGGDYLLGMKTINYFGSETIWEYSITQINYIYIKKKEKKKRKEKVIINDIEAASLRGLNNVSTMLL